MLDQLMGQFDTGGYSPSEEERRRAFQYAVRGLGKGLLKGAFSNQPGGVYGGAAEGLISFGDNFQNSLLEDEKKKNERQKIANSFELDKLQLENAKQGIQENKNKEIDRKGRLQGHKAWVNAMDDNVQEATEYLDTHYGSDSEISKYWKSRFHVAGAQGKQAIQVVDGVETVVPEFAQGAMNVLDEYEKQTGDMAMRQAILDRTDEALARHLGMTVQDGEYVRGDIDKFRSFKAKQEQKKDDLGIKQQQANIAYTRAGINNRENPTPGGPSAGQDGVIPDSVRLKWSQEMSEAYRTVLGAKFDSNRKRFSDDKVQQLALSLGILSDYAPDPEKSFQQFKNQFKTNPKGVFEKEWNKQLEIYNMTGAGGGSAPQAPSVRPTESPDVIQRAVSATGVDTVKQELKKKYPGLTDDLIKALYGI